jgi:hypothetical protein
MGNSIEKDDIIKMVENPKIEEMKKIFNQFDTNKNGYFEDFEYKKLGKTKK